MSDEAEASSTAAKISAIGKVTKYVVGTDWESYTEEMDFFFIANGVSDAKTKKAVLLTNLPAETYQLVKTFVTPELLKGQTITYDLIVERMRMLKQLKPETRFKFDYRARNSGKSVSQYVATLKLLATE